MPQRLRRGVHRPALRRAARRAVVERGTRAHVVRQRRAPARPAPPRRRPRWCGRRRGRPRAPAGGASARTSGGRARPSSRPRAAGREALVGHRDAVLAEPLRLVQRRVGRREQVADRLAVLGERRDADGQGEPPAVQVDGGQRPLQAAADRARVRLRRRRQEQRELLAAEPEGAVVRPHAVGEQRPTRRSASSPATWPRRSFRSLKSSRSPITSAKPASAERHASISAAPSSWKRRWFGRPVSASVSDAATTASYRTRLASAVAACAATSSACSNDPGDTAPVVGDADEETEELAAGPSGTITCAPTRPSSPPVRVAVAPWRCRPPRPRRGRDAAAGRAPVARAGAMSPCTASSPAARRSPRLASSSSCRRIALGGHPHEGPRELKGQAHRPVRAAGVSARSASASSCTAPSRAAWSTGAGAPTSSTHARWVASPTTNGSARPLRGHGVVVDADGIVHEPHLARRERLAEGARRPIGTVWMTVPCPSCASSQSRSLSSAV